MIIPHEFEQAWIKEFPASSHSVATLREDLIRADWLRRCARTVFDEIHQDLSLTCLPMPYWDALTQKQYRFVERHAARTQQEFRKAFQILHALKPAPVKPEPAPPAPPQPKRDFRPVFQQTVEVSVVDGKTVTNADCDARFFLRPDVLEKAGGMWRLFHFKDKVVPQEYAYTLEHDGTSYQPTQSILISYRTEDFKDICLRELQTESEHLLDGRRWGYKHI